MGCPPNAIRECHPGNAIRTPSGLRQPATGLVRKNLFANHSHFQYNGTAVVDFSLTTASSLTHGETPILPMGSYLSKHTLPWPKPADNAGRKQPADLSAGGRQEIATYRATIHSAAAARTSRSRSIPKASATPLP
jgi:hypothetical protein